MSTEVASTFDVNALYSFLWRTPTVNIYELQHSGCSYVLKIVGVLIASSDSCAHQQDVSFTASVLPNCRKAAYLGGHRGNRSSWDAWAALFVFVC